MEQLLIAETQKIHIKYVDEFKPILAEVENNYQKFPKELITYFRNYNDYLAALQLETNIKDNDYEIEYNKSLNCLDDMINICYYYLIIFYCKKIKKVFSTIDSKVFISVFSLTGYNERKEIYKKAIIFRRRFICSVVLSRIKRKSYYDIKKLLEDPKQTYNNISNLVNDIYNNEQFTINKNILIPPFHIKRRILIYSITTLVACLMSLYNKDIVEVLLNQKEILANKIIGLLKQITIT